MNIFVQELARSELSEPEHHLTKLVVEDNIGESVHVHVRNFRLEMSIEDFQVFAEAIDEAGQEFNHGNC